GSDPVAEDMNRLGLAGEAGGQLLGDEAVVTVRQLQAAVDRVVVGDRDEVHAAPLGELVDLLRGGRALGQAERSLDPEPRELRSGRMAVHVYSGSHRRLPARVALFMAHISLIAGKTCESAENGR